MSRRFLDSNILIGAIGERDTPDGQRSYQLIRRIIGNGESVIIEPTVVLESTFVLSRRVKLPIQTVSATLVALVSVDAVHCSHKQQVLEALERWRELPVLSFADWFHLVMAREAGATEIYSFDRAMDRLPGVTRVEP